MPEVLQNVVNNAQSLQGLEYVGFGLICALALAGLVGLVCGLYLFFKPYHASNVADIGGVFQGLMSLISLGAGFSLLAGAYALLTTFFGGS